MSIDRLTLLKIKEKIEESKKTTLEARNKKNKKKKNKKDIVKDRTDTEYSGIPDFDKDFNCGQSNSNVIKSSQVEKWFNKGIDFRTGLSVTHGKWGGKQFTLAKRMLDTYGAELVENAINYMCDNWSKMVEDSGGKLSGIPTVELLWSIRNRIFPDVEKGIPYKSSKKRKYNKKVKDNRGEYKDPSDKNKRDGW